MAQREIPDECKSVWQRLHEADVLFNRAQYELFTNCRESIVDLLRIAFRDSSQYQLAFRVASLLNDPEQKKTLFPEFLGLACQPSYVPTILAARKAALSLSKEWLLANIEVEAEQVLNWSDDWEFRRFLELCSLIDTELTIRNAKRATASENSDIREAGEDFLKDPSPVSIRKAIKHEE
jgi:hypothetical protein